MAKEKKVTITERYFGLHQETQKTYQKGRKEDYPPYSVGENI